MEKPKYTVGYRPYLVIKPVMSKDIERRRYRTIPAALFLQQPSHPFITFLYTAIILLA